MAFEDGSLAGGRTPRYYQPNTNPDRYVQDVPQDVVPNHDTPAPPQQPRAWDEGQFWRDWLGGGYKTTSDLTNFIQNGGWGSHVQQFGSKNDKIRTPGGGEFDAVFSAGVGGGLGAQRLDLRAGGGGAAAQGPMVMPNGAVPPGVPYNPVASPLNQAHEALLQKMLTTPKFDQSYLNQLNEQQKEMILQRGGESRRVAQQQAASRGVSQGGAAQATQRRLRDDDTANLLQSQRDTSLQTTAGNYEGSQQALQQNLDWQRYLEAIRQYGLDDKYRYNMANANSYQHYINSILGG